MAIVPLLIIFYVCFLNAGTTDHAPTDCRTEGCGKNAECIREGAAFVCHCLPGTTGRAEVECRSGRTTNIL